MCIRDRSCYAHKKEGYVSVIGRICEEVGCLTRAWLGPEGCKPLSCSAHKKEGYVFVEYRECEAQGCYTVPTFGPCLGKPIRCEAHKYPGDVDLCSAKCKSEACVHSYEKYERPRAVKISPVSGKKELCIDCWRSVHPELDGKLSVRKEHFILAELQRLIPELEEYFLTHDCRIPGQTCSSKRPDMVWIVNDTLIHIEIDEWGNKHEDNLERLVGIHAASGLMYHSCIRFNPDPYEDYPACLKRTQTRSGEPVYRRNTYEWDRRIPILVEKMKQVFEACIQGSGSLVAGKVKLCF